MTEPPKTPLAADDLAARLAAAEAGENSQPLDTTVRNLQAELNTLAERLLQPVPPDEFEHESALARGLEAALAFGRDPQTNTLQELAAAERDAPPRMIGPYRLLEKIGEGGMGAVYKALHTRLEKVVAIKILPPQHTLHPAAVARFLREMKAVGQLNHPHVVTAHDADECDGQHYLVMEFVAGIDLATLVRQAGPLPVAEACELARQAVIGLQSIHQQGMVHRDIKPSNLMLSGIAEVAGLQGDPTTTPQLKILDLGLALLAADASSPDTNRELTSTNQAMGTLEYMAPEQASDSHSVDARADLYSLGATLYKLLSGHAPFSRERFDSPVKLLTALATQPAPTLATRRPDLPRELIALVDRLLAREPGDRFPHAAAVAAALLPFARGADLRTLGGRRAGTLARPDVPDEQAVPSHAPSDPYAKTVAVPAPTLPSTLPYRPATWPLRRRPAWGAAIVTALLLIGLALAGVIFKVKTPTGTVVLECDPALLAGAEISVNGQQITLTDPRDGKTLTIEAVPEKGELKITKPGFEQFAKTYDLTQDGKRIAVRLVETPALDIPIPTTPVNAQGKPIGAGTWVAGSREVTAADCPRRTDIDPYELTVAGMGDSQKAPPELVAIFGDSRLRHWGEVARTVFTPDSKTLISIGHDGAVRLWSVETGKQLRQFSAWGGGSDLVVSPDGRRLFAPHGDRELAIWNLESGTLESTVSTGYGGAVSPDGSRCFVYDRTNEGSIRVIHIADKKILWTSDAKQPNAFHVAAWAPDGKSVAFKIADGSIHVADAKSGQVSHRLTPKSAVRNLVVSPDGKLLACNTQSLQTEVWNMETGVLVTVVNHGRDGASFSSDGKLLACATYSDTRFFDTSTWKETRRQYGLEQTTVTAVSFSPDGKWQAAADRWGRIRLFDAKAGAEKLRPESHHGFWGTCDFTPDFSRLVTGNDDGTIRIWNVATGKVEHTLQTKETDGRREVHCVAFAPNGRTFACAGCGQIELFDVANGKRLTAWTGDAIWLEFAPDGRSLFGLDSSGNLVQWATATGVTLATHKNIPRGSIRFTPDGNFLFGSPWGGSGAKPWLRRADDLSLVWERPGTAPEILSMRPAFHPHGQFAAIRTVVNEMAMAEVIQLSDGKSLRAFQHQRGIVEAMAFAPDGETLATTQGARVHFWALNPRLGQSPLLKTITLHEPSGGIIDIRYTPDGRHLFTLNGNGTVYLLRLQDGPVPDAAARATFAGPLPANPPRPIAGDPGTTPADQLRREDIDPYELTVAGMGDSQKAPKELVAILGDSRLRHWHAGLFGDAKFHPTEKQLVSMAEDGTVRFWDLATGREVNRLVSPKCDNGRMQISSDGKFLTLTNGHGSHHLDLWDLANRKLVRSQPCGGFAIAISPDGKRMAMGRGDAAGNVGVSEILSQKVVWENEGHRTSVRAAAWSRDGRWVATLGADDQVRVWNAETGIAKHTLRGGVTAPHGIAFSPDSQLVAAMGAVWHVESGELVKQLETDGDYQTCCFAPNGEFLVMGHSVFDTTTWKLIARHPDVRFIRDVSSDSSQLAFGVGQFHVIDVKSGKRLYRPETHAGWWSTLDVSPDGSRFLTTNSDGTVHLWNTATRKVERVLRPSRGTVGTHFGPSIQAVFSPDGRRIACTTWRHVDLFDAATGNRLLTTDPHHPNLVYSVAFSPDGRTLASICNNDVLCTWSTTTGLRLSAEPKVPVGTLAYSPDGELLIRTPPGGDGHHLWVKRVHDASIAWKTDIHHDMHRLRTPIHPGGQLVALRRGNEKGPTADVVRAIDGKLIRSFQHPGHSFGGMAFSPDGTTLATAQSGKIHFWSLNAGLTDEPLVKTITLHEPGGAISDLRYSPDGRHLFTLNGNGTVYVLRLQDGPAPDAASLARFAAPLVADEATAALAPDGDWAVEFNGENTLGTGPYLPLDKSPQFTAEAWVKDWTGVVFHTGRGDRNDNSAWLHKGWDNGLRLWGGWEQGDGKPTHEFKLWLPHTRADGWMHLALTFDGKVRRVFVNGELADEKTVPMLGSTNPADGFQLGSFRLDPAANKPGEHGRGLLSQVRFSSVARYAQPFAPPRRFDSDDQTLALYRFDRGQGDIIRDQSPHARDMTLKNHRWRKSTPPTPPLEELLKDAKWQTLVDEKGKVVVKAEHRHGGEPVSDTNRQQVSITPETPQGLTLSGQLPRVVFAGPESNRLVLRTRVRVQNVSAVLGITPGANSATEARCNGRQLVLDAFENGRAWGAFATSVSVDSADEFDLVIRISPDRMSAYVNGVFAGSVEGTIRPGLPHLGINHGRGSFRNVEVFVLPEPKK